MAVTGGPVGPSRKSPGVLVPFLGALVTGVGFLFLGVSAGPTSGFGLVITLFGVGFLVTAALIWRRSRIGYLVGIVVSGLTLALFGGAAPSALTSFADQLTFLAFIILLPAIVLTLVYALLGVRVVWRKGTMQKPGRMIPLSSVLAVVTVGFVLGGVMIGILAGGQVTALVASSNAKADITIVSGAANSGTQQPFTPGNFTVKVGGTVTWVNKDTTTHTVTSTSVPSGAKTFDSGNLPYGLSFSVKFDQPGTYQYYCSIHPSMKGTIIVMS
ncbi:MAG: plastocyanin/azurin family copper-binding protein [Thaumarchaeota archaeon]|nr:plastocyanin/azurin family copper-binding protein [Nitrososphaerota archaeon]